MCRTLYNYIEVLKPSASILLAFIGTVSAVIAGDGNPPLPRLFLVLITVLVLSAGVNGLTNYLDRGVDARMQRTRHRALPSKRINPPEKALALLIGLTIIGLVLAWWLHPLSLLFGIVGTLAATFGRKRVTCVFPQGMIASCAPVLIGWFAINPSFGWELLLLCALIAVWLPLHVYSIMVVNREDYISAGLTFFPMSREAREAVKILLFFSLVLGITAIALYFVADFTVFYLVIAGLLTVIMVYATVRLVVAVSSNNAWKLYKISAFPYLGIIFLIMALDVWFL